jgi:hypothetical protein
MSSNTLSKPRRKLFLSPTSPDQYEPRRKLFLSATSPESQRKKSKKISKKKSKKIISKKKAVKKTALKKKSMKTIKKKSVKLYSPLQTSPFYSTPIRKTPLQKTPFITKLKTPPLTNKKINSIVSTSRKLTQSIIKSFKENASPTLLQTNHIGSFNSRNLSTNYFLDKYKSIICPLNLTIETIYDKVENRLNLHIINKNNNDISVELLMIYNVEDGEIYGDVLLKELAKKISKCSKKKFRFTAIQLSLYSDEEGGHANLLMIDNINKTVERYDPHGFQTMDVFKPILLDKALERWFREDLKYTYLPTVVTNTIQGLQHYQCRDSTRECEGEIKGYCAAWMLFYFHMRLEYPDMSQKDIKLKCLRDVNQISGGNLTNFIRSYSGYLRRITGL